MTSEMRIDHQTAHDLANEGARYLSKQPALALEYFDRARAIFLALGDPSTVSTLSCLFARAWHRHGSLAHAMKWASKAVQEDPCSHGAAYTLAHFYEEAAEKAALLPSKRTRALKLFYVAQASYRQAAAYASEGEQREGMHRRATVVFAHAKRLSES